MQKMLAETNRDMSTETVIFLGLGHVGEATLTLTLEAGFRPQRLLLCDTAGKAARVHTIAEQISARYGIPTEQISTILSEPGRPLPPVVYEATFWAVSVSAAYIIEVELLRPGSLIIDDSYPPACRPQALQRRRDTRGDILYTVAGALQTMAPGDEIKFELTPLSQSGPPQLIGLAERSAAMQRITPTCLTGCIFSSFLNGHYDLPLELGPVQPHRVLKRYRTLRRMGHRGTPFYSFPAPEQTDSLLIVFDDAYVAKFRQPGGRAPSSRL
jgi:hypothetical protein